jgi:hypothetical protein
MNTGLFWISACGLGPGNAGRGRRHADGGKEI